MGYILINIKNMKSLAILLLLGNISAHKLN